MYTETRVVNRFLRTATKAEIEDVLSTIILTERQKLVFELYFLNGHDINFIADKVYVSSTVISRELQKIRLKIFNVLKRQ